MPTKFKGKDNDLYLLIGGIEYDGPDVMKQETDVGHYTALRYTTNWTRYDDLSEGPTHISSSKKFKMKLIFYVKSQEKFFK